MAPGFGETWERAHDVTYGYDAAGNRLTMTDGMGTIAYTYDGLSRLTKERRTFADASNPSINNVARELSYDYYLAGGLKHVQDHDGRKIKYQYDDAGRMTNVTGEGVLYDGVSAYASGMEYRAWGALKAMNYSNGRTLSLSYNSRLQVSKYEVPGIANMEFQYAAPGGAANDNDGRVKFMRDLTTPDSKLDRLYTYGDEIGRLTRAATGSLARGGPDTNDSPFLQNYTYDVRDNLTDRSGRHWSETPPATDLNFDPATNRTAAWNYDASGRPTFQDSVNTKYDSAGRIIAQLHTDPPGGVLLELRLTYGRDGDGQQLKQSENEVAKYYLRSTVLGGAVVTELGAAGQFLRGYVHGPGGMPAQQQQNQWGEDEVRWLHRNPVTGSLDTTVAGGFHGGGATELDPLGVDAWRLDRYQLPAPEPWPGRDSEQLTPRYGDAFNFDLGCTLDGVIAACGTVARAVGMGATAVEHLNYRPTPRGGGPHFVYEQQPIEPLGLGLFRTRWPFVNDGGKARNKEPFVDWQDLVLNFAPQISGSDCGKFVWQLLERTNLPRSMAAWVEKSIVPVLLNRREETEGEKGFGGFKEKYTAGGQGAWAKVHIAGVAAATLIGKNKVYPLFGHMTGEDVVRGRYNEDRGELQRGLDRQAQGEKTIDYTGNRNYDLDTYS